MIAKFTFQSVVGNSRRNPRRFSARGREESLESYSILWSDWPTSKQKVHVTEIVVPLGIADAIFRRQRSDDRKCVCFSQASQTRVHKSLIYIGNLARHSFSLFDGNKTQPQTSKTSEQRLAYHYSRKVDGYRNSLTIKFCADLFPAHRCPSVIKFQIRLECASENRSNVLLISKAYFPANKMNWM